MRSYFEDIPSRSPQIAYGYIHMYNCYVNGWHVDKFGSNAIEEGNLLYESNIAEVSGTTVYTEVCDGTELNLALCSAINNPAAECGNVKKRNNYSATATFADQNPSWVPDPPEVEVWTAYPDPVILDVPSELDGTDIVTSAGLTTDAYHFYEDCDYCPVDVTGDCVINISDQLAVTGAWGRCSGPCPEDINGDGTVDGSDLLQVLARFNDSCARTCPD